LARPTVRSLMQRYESAVDLKLFGAAMKYWMLQAQPDEIVDAVQSFVSGKVEFPSPRELRLAYYAALLPGKQRQYQRPEGYRLYKSVAICRTGSQDYFGRELKKNEGYRSEWGMKDDQMVRVYRPVEEVTARETVASFEGVSVLDEHPAGDKVLIDALDEFDGATKGHVQNVQIGDPIKAGEFAGETPLIADLWVKHPDLNLKIEGGVRDVSCGYTFVLDKIGGRYIMRNIRGNHVAVVPKGRGGSEIGIKDSKPLESDRDRWAAPSESERALWRAIMRGEAKIRMPWLRGRR
jgi:hypothetical protein